MAGVFCGPVVAASGRIATHPVCVGVGEWSSVVEASLWSWMGWVGSVGGGSSAFAVEGFHSARRRGVVRCMVVVAVGVRRMVEGRRGIVLVGSGRRVESCREVACCVCAYVDGVSTVWAAAARHSVVVGER